MVYWSLQDVKAHFSEFIQSVLKDGPLGINLRGKKEIVVLSRKDYEALKGKKPNFLTFMNQSPLKGVELDVQRDKSSPREF